MEDDESYKPGPYWSLMLEISEGPLKEISNSTLVEQVKISSFVLRSFLASVRLRLIFYLREFLRGSFIGCGCEMFFFIFIYNKIQDVPFLGGRSLTSRKLRRYGYSSQ
jgi:hypothetical protein